MIKIWRGLILENHIAAITDFVLIDCIFPEPVDHLVDCFNWNHPGSYWIVLE